MEIQLTAPIQMRCSFQLLRPHVEAFGKLAKHTLFLTWVTHIQGQGQMRPEQLVLSVAQQEHW